MKKIKFLSSMAIASMLAFGIVSCEQPNVDEPNTDEPNTEEPVKPESGEPVVMEDFTVTLNHVHSGDVFLTIEPEDKDMTYWYQL